jgi:hypothetical protein
MIFRRFLSIFLLILLVLFFNPLTMVRAASSLQISDPATNARQMLAKMTPEERVGQLF